MKAHLHWVSLTQGKEKQENLIMQRLKLFEMFSLMHLNIYRIKS